MKWVKIILLNILNNEQHERNLLQIFIKIDDDAMRMHNK